MKIAEYKIINNKNVFQSIIEAPVINGVDVVIYNSTKTLPDVLPTVYQDLILENAGTEDEKWVLVDRVIEGIFYLMSSGEMHESVLHADLHLYTDKNPQLNDGDIANFDIQTKSWVLTHKGDITKADELSKAKTKLRSKIFKHWEAKRTFIVRNGVSMPIQANQEIQDNLDTWIGRMKDDIEKGVFQSENEAYYSYIGLKISYKNVIKLANTISGIRTKYVSYRDYHTGNQYGVIGQVDKITIIEDLTLYENNLEYTKDSNGSIVGNPEDFILS